MRRSVVFRSSGWWSALALAGACTTSTLTTAGWPFSADDGPRRGTPEWYAAHADDPVGQRQRYLFGKVWPVQPRPVGPHQLFVHKYHAAHAWPYPYVCDDRRDTIAIMDTQVANGWLAATTLYDYHFDVGTHELNPAGLAHVSWIVSHVPVEHQQASIAATSNPEWDRVRYTSVQKSIASLAGDRGIPIASRLTHSVGRPAAEVQAIHEAREANALPPVISYQSEIGGSSSGGGGGGGGM